MNAKELKKKLILRVIIYAATLIGIILICIYMNNTKTKINEKYDWLKNDIFSLNKKLQGLDKKALVFSEALSQWKSIGEDQKKLQGLRINYAKDLLDELKKTYKLSENMNISFSKPEELKDDYKTETVSVISSKVSITFAGITDEPILNFVGALLNDYPGYIQIHSFSIKRSKAITKDVLEKLATGYNPGLVDGKIDFIWRDLKYKGPVSSDKESG